MENKVDCIICNKKITNKNQYIASHVKRIHKIDFYDYIEKYYKNTEEKIKSEKCGFCDKIAIPNYNINHDTKTYNIDYNNGYWCRSEKCKNDISVEILKHSYNKKTFEHIGSKSEYLSKLYKKPIDIVKREIKYTKRENLEKYKSSLQGYILRYGKEEGERKYKERCNKISKSNKKEWYINKFGEDEGNKRWDDYIMKLSPTIINYIKKYGKEEGERKYKERCNKISKSNKKEWYINKFGEDEGNKRWKEYTNKIRKNNRKNKSKSSKKLEKIFKELDLVYEDEYEIKELNNYSDYYLKEYDTIIEYYGDYWHCNPKYYESDYFHSYIKLTAKEIWEKDNKRINNIYNKINKNIIIIWEDTKINKSLLIKILNDNINKKNIIYV